MDQTLKKSANYYIIVILFSWTFWICAMVISIKNQITIPYNEGFYTIFSKGYESLMQMILHIIFSIAVYGPLIGVLIFKVLLSTGDGASSKKLIDRGAKYNTKFLIFVFVYPVILLIIQ